MIKRVVQTLAVAGMLAILYITGNVQKAEREALQASAGAVGAQETPLPAETASPGSSETGGKEDEPQVHPVQLPLRPEENVTLSGDEPAMGAFYSASKPRLVGIDPGHLGYTSKKYFNTGAVSVYGTVEYVWTLKIGNLLAEELTERGYDVYLVRTTNEKKEFPYNNAQRAWAANEMNCDILLEIHWDSSDDEEISGYHTIYRGNKSSQSYRLAKAISDAYGGAVAGQLKKRTEPVSRTDLWELNSLTMPAMLLECGFSSNRDDATWLEDDKNHSTIVKAIADGIDSYFAGERERER